MKAILALSLALFVAPLSSGLAQQQPAAPVFIDVTAPSIDPLFITQTPISEGAYTITRVRFGPINVWDTDFDVSSATTCGESQFFLDSNNPINVIDLANTPSVMVTRDADNLLNVNIDVNLFLTAFQDAFICTGGVNGALGPFVATTFANANGTYLSFN